MNSNSENEKQQIEKLRQEAQKHTKAATEAASRGREAGWEWAKHAAIVHDQSLFRYEGLESFDIWAQVTGAGAHGTYWAWLRRYQELSPLYDFAELKKVGSENADNLIKLPIKSRTESMLAKAQEMQAEEFARVVERHLEKFASDDKPAPELKVAMNFRATTSQKKVIEQSMVDFAKKHNIEGQPPAKILELMAAESYTNELREDDARLLVTYLVPELRRVLELVDDEEHDPTWRLQQCKAHLRRAFETLLKPQATIERVKEEIANKEQTPEEARENASNFFKTTAAD